MDSQEQIVVYMHSFGGVQRVSYFGRESVMRTEVKVRVGKI